MGQRLHLRYAVKICSFKVLFFTLAFQSGLKWFGGIVCKSSLSGLQLRLETWCNFMYSLNCIDISDSESFNTVKSILCFTFSHSLPVLNLGLQLKHYIVGYLEKKDMYFLRTRLYPMHVAMLKIPVH